MSYTPALGADHACPEPASTALRGTASREWVRRAVAGIDLHLDDLARTTDAMLAPSTTGAVATFLYVLAP